MLTNIKVKMLGFFSLVVVFTMIIGSFYTWAKKKGKAELEAAVMLRDLNVATAEAEKSEKVKKVFGNSTNTLKAELRQNAVEKQLVIKDAKETRIYDLNKWIVGGLILLSVSCAQREVTLYKTALPYQPLQEVFERPVYSGQIVVFENDNDTVCYSEADFSTLYRFVMELKETIKNYEVQALSTNTYNDFLRELYEVSK